jgi:hypothetical protein
MGPAGHAGLVKVIQVVFGNNQGQGEFAFMAWLSQKEAGKRRI